MDSKDIALLSMEEELERTEKVTDSGSANRAKVLAILEPALAKIEFGESDIRDPKSSSAMLAILDKYVSISKMDEDVAFKRVAAKARLKEIRSSEQQSEATIALIKHQCERDTSKDIHLEGDIRETNLNLSPDLSESIKDTELRDSPDDLT